MIPEELQNVVDEIKKHEGFRSKVYKCTEGYDTIGYGFAIKDLELDEDVSTLILMKKLFTFLFTIMFLIMIVINIHDYIILMRPYWKIEKKYKQLRKGTK